MEPVTAITTGLGIAKGATSLFKEIKSFFDKGTPEEALDAINKAEEKVSELLSNLITVQQSILATQEENRQLREKLSNNDEWLTRMESYELVETEGRAIVFQYIGSPPYYTCPACIESKKEIHTLQDQRVYTGQYRCPSCDAPYLIKAVKPKPARRVQGGLG